MIQFCFGAWEVQAAVTADICHWRKSMDVIGNSSEIMATFHLDALVMGVTV